MAFEVYEFKSRNDANNALVERIGFIAQKQIKNTGCAHLAFSGGKSPIEYFELLSQKDIMWEQCKIALVDERIVPPTHQDSNARLLRTHLLKNLAFKASFTPLIDNADLSIEDLLELANLHYKKPDVAVLGMGLDGHTASLFSSADEFKEALSSEKSIVFLNPKEAAPYQRLSMSLKALVHCGNLFLMISGKEKYTVLKEALKGENFHLPISYILHSKKVQCDVYYAE